jgi:hypothetical protein
MKCTPIFVWERMNNSSYILVKTYFTGLIDMGRHGDWAYAFRDVYIGIGIDFWVYTFRNIYIYILSLKYVSF